MPTPLVRQAAAAGARFIATPEATNILERDRAKLFAIIEPAETDPCVQGLIALARELKVWLLIGSALVKREDGGAANRSMLIDPAGRTVASYDKIHMFDVDLPTGERARESEAYTPGCNAAVVADAVRQARPERLLRHPLPPSVPRARQGRSRNSDGPVRLHPADGRGALGSPPARARDRERRVRARAGAGRAP